MKNYLEKVGDMFRVEERLKEIDPTYEVFYNKKDKRFEVYSKKAGLVSLAFISPFDSLDARLISYARKTRAERADKIIKEIEEENEKIEKANEKLASDFKKEKVKAAISKLQSVKI